MGNQELGMDHVRDLDRYPQAAGGEQDSFEVSSKLLFEPLKTDYSCVLAACSGVGTLGLLSSQ